MSATPLAAILAALDRAGIPHMLTGSLASSLHGQARSTADIDIVIDPSPGAIDRLLSFIDRDRFYVAEDAAHHAAAHRDQFNVVDNETAWKIDLIVRKDRPFSRVEFDRRMSATVTDVALWVASPEDTVLAKLEWASLGGSDRQVQDAVEILRAQGDDIDGAHLDRWAGELGVAALLADARRLALG